MQIKPIKIKKEPEYPTEYLFINNPELFNNYIPLRWRANKVVSSALLAFILAGANSCRLGNNATKSTYSKEQFNSQRDTNLTSSINNSAPIFVHGKGFGVVGCIVASPPVFMTEKEAMGIITDELEEHGITLETTNISIDLDLPIDTTIFKNKITMGIDAINIENNLLLEFISEEDYYNLHLDIYDDTGLSVTSISLKDAADTIRAQVIRKKYNNLILFYDPLPAVKAKEGQNFKTAAKDAKKEAKALLTAQVRDFIQWMKNEGMIK